MQLVQIGSLSEIRPAMGLLKAIERPVPGQYKDAYHQNKIERCYLFIKGEAVLGVLAILYQEESLRAYLSFDEYTLEDRVLDCVWQLLEQAIVSHPERRLFVSLNGRNHRLTQVLSEQGLHQELSVLGYTHNSSEFSPSKHELKRTDFDPKAFKQYQELFGQAYYQIRKENRFYPFNWYENFPDEAYEELVYADSQGGFKAFWDGDRLIGAYLLYQDEIDSLAVHPREWGKGYGSILLGDCLRLIRTRYDQAYLTVMESNSRAINLYERWGFARTSWYKEFFYETKAPL